MKILKVELQNINSLKSDVPISIDFETNDFKDVGLYAITGATGAGKTTILDAITIALYHSVPRFNNSIDKSLENVVSYGAHNAHSRITFENDKEIFEAFWGIRLATKKGVKIKNPKEEVSLKNLSTNTIITSNKKRELVEAVEKVTQLDYTQFLRSVLLAQGEFASFLTAKGSEKGKLLEQITGEDIYKKIGFGISDRKIKEEKLYSELISTINSDDVLSDDKKIEFENSKILKIGLISEIDTKLKAVQFIVDWYKKDKELSTDELAIRAKKNKLAEFESSHKEQLDLLILNHKAEPFKELIQDSNRLEKESQLKLIDLDRLEEDFKELLPNIKSLETVDKSNTLTLEKFETEFKVWQPKFDEVTKLDNQIKNQERQKRETKTNLNQIAQVSQVIQVNLKSNGELIEKLTEAVELIEQETTKQQYLKLVDDQFSDWTKELITLKHHKESILEGEEFIKINRLGIENTTIDLKSNTELLTVEVEKSERLESDLNLYTEKLKPFESIDLNAKKDDLVKKELKWNSFNQFSEAYLKLDKSLIENNAEVTAIEVELEKTNSQIVILTKKVGVHEVLVKDEETILNLEKQIKNYEVDRQKLKAGDECGLCGSKEHPFVNEYRYDNVSKSERELEARKARLKHSIQLLNIETQRKVALDTKQNGLLKFKSNIETQILETKNKSKAIGVDCEINDRSKIEIQFNSIHSESAKLDTEIKIENQLQLKKNNVLTRITQQKEAVNILNRKVGTLNEKLKNNTESVNVKLKTVDHLILIAKNLEAVLLPKLAQFNYILPSIEQTSLFINEVEESISNYRNKLKELEEKKAKLVVINTELINDDKQLKEKVKTREDLERLIKINEQEIKISIEKRQLILPTNVSVEEKRLSLQNQKIKIESERQQNKTVLQTLLDSKTKKVTLKLKITSERSKLNLEIEVLTKRLTELLVESDFTTKQEVEHAILSNEDKDNYAKNRDYIKEENIKIETLSVEWTKNKEALNKSKNFSTAKENITEQFDKLKKEQKEHISALGEIKEAYRKDQEIRDRNKGIYVKIDAQNEIVKVWKQLYYIIGNSKEAFNIYVQRLTLKNLLKLANSHLYQLNKRYSLEMSDTYKPGEELNFYLIDHYQTDQSRLVDTSSGGEKFIISLALALGLSDLASKNVKIDSLFIDEGFGTLDNNTLETVISTLETLQSQGKKIGIISHVENLKERIPTQIQVTKKSNGVSTVEVVY